MIMMIIDNHRHNLIRMAMYAGVSARNYVKEASNAIENEECRVVDEKEALASGIQATSAQL